MLEFLENARNSKNAKIFWDGQWLSKIFPIWSVSMSGSKMSKMLKMGRNRYCIRTAWAPKARRPTSKSTHVRPSSPSVWSNHILCSFYFEFSYLSNVQILRNGHVDQVFHKFCGAIPPSLMVFFLFTLPSIQFGQNLLIQGRLLALSVSFIDIVNIFVKFSIMSDYQLIMILPAACIIAGAIMSFLKAAFRAPGG